MTPSLISRLEAAEVGSRELDAAITVALQLDAKGVTHDDHEYLREVRRDDECTAGTYWRVARSGMSLRTSEPITTSLDAALALAERVLPGWDWSVTTITTTIGGVKKVNALVAPPDLLEGEEITTWGDAATPALAICAALLRAKGSDQ